MLSFRLPPQLVRPPLALVVLTAATLTRASNRGYAVAALKPLILYHVMAVGTFTHVKKPPQTMPIILMLLLYQFVWWGFHDAMPGFVGLHYSLNNCDGFGPLMVIGLGDRSERARLPK